MIISHKHKFIFIKPQKTAGTSVELLLSNICGPDDIITPLGFDPDAKVRESHSPRNYFRSKPFKMWELREIYWFFLKGRKPNFSYWEHLQADKIKEYVGDEVWNNYKKISIVRNPWDHAVSQFYWLQHYGYAGVSNDFEKFIRDIYKTLWGFYSIKDIYCIDYMLRFENLNEDFAKVVEALNLNIDIDLPVTKANTRKVKSYTDVYTEETKELVRVRNLSLLEKWDYNF